MIGILLLLVVAAFVGWFTWLYFVSPTSDTQRIKADQGGTGTKVLKVERIGTKHVRALLTWVAGNPTYFTGGGWYRLYSVTVEKPDGIQETYSVAVEATLFGLPDLQRIDPRAGRSG